MLMYRIYVYLVPIVILAALGGVRWKAGLWGNTIALGAVLFSILIAVAWWEDLAAVIVGLSANTLFVADCVDIWVIFLVSLLLLDTATRYMSTVKVKYNDIVENVGNGLVLILLFVALFGFYQFTEVIGPVGEHDDFDVEQSSFLVKTSIPMFRMLSAPEQGNLSAFSDGYQFDDSEKFLELHLKRRQALMYTQLESGTFVGTNENASTNATKCLEGRGDHE